MKTITFKEMKNKIQCGDFYYDITNSYGFNGWWMYVDKDGASGMTTEIPGAHCSYPFDNSSDIEKVIFVREISTHSLAYFLHSPSMFEENYPDDVYNIVKDNPKILEVNSLIEKLESQLKDAKEELEKIKTK